MYAEPTVRDFETPAAAMDSTTPSKERADVDVQNFGTSIARAILEEKVGFPYPRTEIEKAEARTAAAVRALKIMYG